VGQEQVGKELDSKSEETLVVVKPDSVRRGYVGEILSRFERRGFTIKQLSMITMTKAKAEEFYSVHREKPFFGELVSFISSGPVVGIVISGKDAVETVRRMVGSTKAWESPPGTIRGDLSLGLTDNAVHASDSTESFRHESRVLGFR
jgi:nucleoside-diphosphate kinase